MDFTFKTNKSFKMKIVIIGGIKPHVQANYLTKTLMTEMTFQKHPNVDSLNKLLITYKARPVSM